MYKVTHSRQGDSFGGNGGWITYLSNTAKPFHLYKNTFLQLTSRFLYCAKRLLPSLHCKKPVTIRHAGPVSTSTGKQSCWKQEGYTWWHPLDVPSCCIKSNDYTDLSFPDLQRSEEILDSVIMRANPLLRERWYQNGQIVEESVIFMLGFSVQITLCDMWQFENAQNTPHSTDRSTLDEQWPLNLPKD